jgi:hypothetical protein
LENNTEVFKKTKHRSATPRDPAIPLLGVYLKECNSGYYKGTCTPMFSAALFIRAKLWKQPRCPITEEWIKKICICTQWNFIQPQRRMLVICKQMNETGEHHLKRS